MPTRPFWSFDLIYQAFSGIPTLNAKNETQDDSNNGRKNATKISKKKINKTLNEDENENVK